MAKIGLPNTVIRTSQISPNNHETSHVAIHVWDEDNPSLIQLDVYTCGSLDKQIVLDALTQFDPVKIDYKYLDREKEFITLI